MKPLPELDAGNSASASLAPRDTAPPAGTRDAADTARHAGDQQAGTARDQVAGTAGDQQASIARDQVAGTAGDQQAGTARDLDARRHRFRMIAAFAAVYVLWGSTYIAIRFAIESLPPLMMAGARFIVAGTILYAWARARGAIRPRAIEWRSAVLIGFLLLAIGNGGVVLAEKSVPSSLVALLIAGTPLWMTLLDALGKNGTRPTRAVMFGLIAGLAGVALLIGPTNLAGDAPIEPIGAMLVLTGSLAWSTGSLYSRKAPLPSSPLLATGMEMFAGGLVLLAVGLIRGELTGFDPSTVTLHSVLAWIYLIIAGSLLGFTAYIYLLRHTTPARAATYAYVNPVIAVLLGWALAGEPITPRTLLAGAIIVGALVLITRAKARA